MEGVGVSVAIDRDRSYVSLCVREDSEEDRLQVRLQLTVRVAVTVASPLLMSEGVYVRLNVPEGVGKLGVRVCERSRDPVLER